MNLSQSVGELRGELEAEQMARLSRRTPKRPLILYFGRRHFSDNSKYVFLHHLSTSSEFEILWCTAEDHLADQLSAEGLPVWRIMDDIPATISLFMQAAAVVMSENPIITLRGIDVLMASLDGAAKLQLWHGVSVKHLAYDLGTHIGYEDPMFRRTLDYFGRCDYVLSTASRFDDYWSATFGCPRIVRANQPRNIALCRASGRHELLGARMHDTAMSALSRSDRKRILIAPTWQRNHSLYTTKSEFIRECIDFARSEGAEFFFKGHPVLTDIYTSSSVSESLHILDPSIDVYPYLKEFDALITDYSSIMFDFLYVDRPVLTLNIPPGQHESFEPDFSLVPDMKFSDQFSPGGLAPVLKNALKKDRLSHERAVMRDAVFEVSPLRTSVDLVRIVESLAEAKICPATTVIS